MSKINLTVLLKHLDLNNLSIYEANKSNEEKRKELEKMLPYLLPVWVSGSANGPEQAEILIKFNNQINRNWWELNDSPEMQTKLLAAIGLGKQIRHDFSYRAKNIVSNKLESLLRLRYPDINKDEIFLWCNINSEKTLTELCERFGMQKEEQKTILEEYRKILE